MIQANNIGFWEAIVGLLKKVWGALKKIFVAIFNFLKNLINWFKEKFKKYVETRKSEDPLPADAELISVKIEELLESKDNYNTVNAGIKRQVNPHPQIVKTFYDKRSGKILTDYTEIVEYDKLDDETKEAFADRDMLILT